MPVHRCADVRKIMPKAAFLVDEGAWWYDS